MRAIDFVESPTWRRWLDRLSGCRRTSGAAAPAWSSASRCQRGSLASMHAINAMIRCKMFVCVGLLEPGIFARGGGAPGGARGGAPGAGAAASGVTGAGGVLAAVSGAELGEGAGLPAGRVNAQTGGWCMHGSVQCVLGRFSGAGRQPTARCASGSTGSAPPRSARPPWPRCLAYACRVGIVA